MEKTIRAFIAIGLSPEIRRWLMEARAELERRMTSRSVRWTEFNGIHITLKFLGEIPGGSLGAIQSVMDGTAQGCRPFPLAVEGLGCFPDAVRPRVIWAGVRGNPVLADLQKRLEDGMDKAGFPRERRAFSPHLTLARVRDGVEGKDLGDIGRAVLNAAVSPPVTMDVSGYGLYKSVLRPTGAEYSLLHQAAFGSRG
jgi:2'-5' RNA ligase